MASRIREDEKTGRTWNDMSIDILVMIYKKLSVEDLVTGAPFCCSCWYMASKEPFILKHGEVDLGFLRYSMFDDIEIRKKIIDFVVARSQGYLTSVKFPWTTDSVDLLLHLAQRRRIMHYHMEIFKKVDVIVTPTTGMTAPLIIPSSALKFGETNLVVSGYLMRFIIAANLLGLPAITVPDTIGHGTHTASTAAGNEIKNASFYGVAQGNARGAVPSARVAVYKVCWGEDCDESDILAAFDDGVDILSVSLGSDIADQYHSDPMAIGAFHAMQKGILTSQSAGNNGPQQESVVSAASWSLFVAASSTDRQIIDKILLGDDSTYVGRAINSFDMKGKMFPLIRNAYPESVSDMSSNRLYDENLLGTNSIEGKIVFHSLFSLGQSELFQKAAGLILGLDEYNDFSWNYPLPASLVTAKDGESVLSYIRNTK